MSIADWLAAARADAEAAQRDGGWYSMLDLRGTYDMHGIDAAHIAHYGPDVALRLLEAAQFVSDLVEHHWVTPCTLTYEDAEEIINALRVAVEGAGE